MRKRVFLERPREKTARPDLCRGCVGSSRSYGNGANVELGWIQRCLEPGQTVC